MVDCQLAVCARFEWFSFLGFKCVVQFWVCFPYCFLKRAFMLIYGKEGGGLCAVTLWCLAYVSRRFGWYKYEGCLRLSDIGRSVWLSAWTELN